MTWKRFPHFRPFGRGIQRCGDSLHKRPVMFLCCCLSHIDHDFIPWWRHQMETFSALLAICAENSPVTGEFPTQRPVTRSFDVFFDLRPNERLSKQSWGWWYETLSSPLWRHRNAVWNNNRHKARQPTLCRLFLMLYHYNDVIMSTIGSQLTSLAIVYSIVYSGADQSKHQSSASLAFVWGIHRGPVNSPHKGPVTRKMFPFDDVIMSC